MQFRAEVLSTGRGGHAVVVPAEVAAGLSSRRAPVVVEIGGVVLSSRLAVYGGRCYLGLRLALLRQLGVSAGDEVTIDLREDSAVAAEAPVAGSAPSPPEELLAALASDPAAADRFAALATEDRDEYVRWVARAEDAPTRADRVERTLRRLRRS